MIIRSGRLAKIRWSACMLKSHRSLCIIIIIIVFFVSFSHWCKLLILHCNLSGCNSSQISWNILSIPIDHHNTVVWIASILPLISYSCSIFFLAFGKRSKYANYNRYHHHPQFSQLFKLHLARYKYMSLLLFFFIFTFWLAWTIKSTQGQLETIKLGLKIIILRCHNTT